MKKITTVLLASAVMLGFISCEKNNEASGDGVGKTLSGTIVDVPQDAGAMILKAIAYSDTDEGVLAEGAVAANGNFRLELPGTVPSKLLTPYSESDINIGGIMDMDGVPENWVTVSNENAKVCLVSFELYGDDDPVDDIYCAYLQYLLGVPSNIALATYLYADSPFTVSGSTEFSIDADMSDVFPIAPSESVKVKVDVASSFAKGWNVMAASIVLSATAEEVVATVTVNNTVPSECKWQLSSDLDDIFW